VLIALTSLMAFSGTMVSFAPNYEILMVGRALIGVAIGGFWSMSAATIMRLVPEESVPRGLAIIYGGKPRSPRPLLLPLAASWGASSVGEAPFSA